MRTHACYNVIKMFDHTSKKYYRLLLNVFNGKRKQVNPLRVTILHVSIYQDPVNSYF